MSERYKKLVEEYVAQRKASGIGSAEWEGEGESEELVDYIYCHADEFNGDGTIKDYYIARSEYDACMSEVTPSFRETNWIVVMTDKVFRWTEAETIMLDKIFKENQ